jgi:hypothetical protein
VLTLTFGACVPGSLTLEAGDASTGDDGPRGDSAGADGTATGSSGAETGADADDGPAGDTGDDATGAGDTGIVRDSSSSSSGGDTGVDTGTVDTGTADTGHLDTGTVDTGTDAPLGCACIAPPPSGWTLVAFDATSRNGCPTGYGTPSDVIVDPTDLGPSTCDCTCDVDTLPNCYTGQLTVNYGNTLCDTPASGLNVADGGGCVVTLLPFAAPLHAVVPIPPFGGSCTPTQTETPPSPGGFLGKTCTVSGPLSNGGCPGSTVCAPPGTTLFSLCIQHPGPLPCPAGYTQTHSTGTGLTPGGCSTCTCPTPTTTCDNATFTLYSDSACGTQIASEPADSVCRAVTANVDGNSYEYVATPDTTCVPPAQQPTPLGSSSLSGQMTVCCP